MRLEVGMKKIPDWILALLIFFLLLFAVIGIHYSSSISGKDDIRNAGYEEGHEKGYEEGYNQGYSDGIYDGYADAYWDGYSDGYDDGYRTG
jgi:flagellar biosynthesis/type III secretory pathway protein FliH